MTGWNGHERSVTAADPYPTERAAARRSRAAVARPSRTRAEAARATMTALASSPDVFETFFDQARIGLALADLSLCYVRVNSTYAEMVGVPPEDLVGEPFMARVHVDDRANADER